MKRRAAPTTPSRTACRQRIATFRSWVDAYEPDLVVESGPELLRISGSIAVDIGAGVQERYTLSIEYPTGDPFALPTVFDTGGHFSPADERHIVASNSGPAWWCLWFNEEPEYDPLADDALPRLLGLIRGFIYRQIVYEDRVRQRHPHPWPGREWGHGINAYDEWVSECIGDIPLTELPRLLPYIRGAPLSWNKRCPCGSGERSGACHFEPIQRLLRAQRPQLVELAALRRLNGEAHV